MHQIYHNNIKMDVFGNDGSRIKRTKRMERGSIPMDAGKADCTTCVKDATMKGSLSLVCKPSSQPPNVTYYIWKDEPVFTTYLDLNDNNALIRSSLNGLVINVDDFNIQMAELLALTNNGDPLHLNQSAIQLLADSENPRETKLTKIGNDEYWIPNQEMILYLYILKYVIYFRGFAGTDCPYDVGGPNKGPLYMISGLVCPVNTGRDYINSGAVIRYDIPTLNLNRYSEFHESKLDSRNKDSTRVLLELVSESNTRSDRIPNTTTNIMKDRWFNVYQCLLLQYLAHTKKPVLAEFCAREETEELKSKTTVGISQDAADKGAEFFLFHA
jgi:hypothetical protein